MLTNSTKDIQHNQKAANTMRKLKSIFQAFLSFIDSTEQQIPRPTDNEKKQDILFGQEEKTYCKDTDYG